MKLLATHAFTCIVLMVKFGRTSCENIPLALLCVSYILNMYTCNYVCTFIIVHTGPVIIRSSADVENGSIINDFAFNGNDTKLSLTCTSVYQNEIVEWIKMDGNVEEERSSTLYLSTISFINPTDDFNTTFRCKSHNTLLYKDVFITNRKFMHCGYIGISKSKYADKLNKHTYFVMLCLKSNNVLFLNECKSIVRIKL